VKLLAKRLHEDKKLAEQKSKLGQESAKRYYDSHTKLEQFNKGDFVCEHDHTHKRSMARKFSYQYTGPFEFQKNLPVDLYRTHGRWDFCNNTHK